MAKALCDNARNGTIIPIDVLPNDLKIYWNSISDLKGKQTRRELLKKWRKLTQEYIIFLQGDTRLTLQRLSLDRIHIAYLDACHTYEDVLIESIYIAKKQKKGDLIIYDDFNEKDFKGLTKAVRDFTCKYNYNLRVIKGVDNRHYAIARK